MQGKLKAALAAQNGFAAGQVEQPAARSKFGNVKVTNEDGLKFDSKLEERVYCALCAKYGKRFVYPHFKVPLPGGVYMVLDFLVVYLDRRNRVRYRLFDAKGMITRDWKTKAKIFGALSGTQIETVKHEREV